MAYTRRNTTDGVTIMNKDLYDNLQDGIEERGITPEMFGAKGDGVTDDSDALNEAFNVSDKVILGPGKIYRIKNGLRVYRENFYLIGNNSTILVDSLFNPSSDDRFGVIRLESTNKHFVGEGVTLKITSSYSRPESYTMYGLYMLPQKTKSVSLKKFNIIFDELELPQSTSRHCMTFTGSNLIIEQCNFWNKAKSVAGGCLWIDSDEDFCIVNIKNSEFINFASDEVFASYGSGEKHIFISGSYFVHNTEYLKKNTIMMAFYKGENFVSFDSSLIEQYGLNDSFKLATLIRGGDEEGKEVSVSFVGCIIRSKLNSGIFTTTNRKPLGNFHIHATDCYIENTLGPIIGSWSPYEEGIGNALPATYCILDQCKLKSLYAIAEGSNNTLDIYKVILNNCIAYIEQAKRGFYCYYNNTMMLEVINSFIDTDTEVSLVYTRSAPISGTSPFYKSFVDIKNSFLNGELIVTN